jgi:hypothetical protein
VTVLAFTPGRHAGRWTWPGRRVSEVLAAAAPMMRPSLARAALALGVWLLAGPGWALLTLGVLVAAWPRRAAR